MQEDKTMGIGASWSLKTWARYYTDELGLRVLPCDGAKRPTIPAWTQIGMATEDQINRWWDDPRAVGIGALMGQGMLALDADAKYGGPETLRTLEHTHEALPVTWMNHTGSGGGSHHRLFSYHKSLHIAKRTGTTAQPFKGVDLMAEGSYIVLPPSPHPSGNYYAWDADFHPDKVLLAPLPDWLLPLLLQESPSGFTWNTPSDEPIPPSASNGLTIPEGDRNNTLYQRLRPYGLRGAPVQEAYAEAQRINRDECETPLPEKEVRSTLRSAYAPSKFAHIKIGGQFHGPGIPRPEPPPREEAPPDESSEKWDDWRSRLMKSKDHRHVYQNAFNFGQILAHDPFWKEPVRKLWYDVVRGHAMCGDEVITKTLVVHAAQWFGHMYRLGVSQIMLLKECMEAQAAADPVDLLQHHINALPPWDGVARLDTWLHDIAGVDVNPYTTHISRALPVSMIARAMVPGCPCRMVVIFQGQENAGKSHLVEALATPDWYAPLSMSLEGRESHMMLHKYWVAELVELDSLTRTEESRMKAFVTMKQDTYVPKYSNASVSIHRRTIFIGTTNETSDYLKGQSGNTRYYPVTVANYIAVDQFKAMRDQLFAEARLYYDVHAHDWWQEETTVQEQAELEREIRRETSQYQDALELWLETERFDPGHFVEVWDYTRNIHVKQHVEFVRDETNWQEIARWFLGIETRDRWANKAMQMQIASALKALGWTKNQHTDSKKTGPRRTWTKKRELPF